MTTHDATLSAALAAAAAGYRVLPLTARKGPLFKTGEHHAAATTDRETIVAWWRRWPQANVGLVNGPESDMFTVDVDVKNGALGLSTLRGIERKRGRLPRTWTQLTPSGGRHYLYRWPSGADRLRRGLGPGVELQGAGRITVLAPSRSADPVRWPHPYGTHRPMQEITDAPAWLAELVLPEVKRPSRRGRPELLLAPGEVSERGRRRLAGITTRLASAQPGERHDVLLWAAARAAEEVAAGGVAEDVAAGEIDAAVAMWGLPQTPVEQVRVSDAIRDGFAYGGTAL